MTRRCAWPGCQRSPMPAVRGLAHAYCAACLQLALSAMFGRAK